MVTGSSQGARAINAAVSGAAAALRGFGVQVLHITGPQHAVQVTDGHPAHPPHVVIPYVEAMQDAYAMAAVVICRSGGDDVRRTGRSRPAVAGGGAVLVDNTDLGPAWIETNPDPGAHRSRSDRGDVGPRIGGRRT
jgi:UDP-N-acetylglucosamine--N-acetylmuramyl-(pentapeptide) pyrophosphoryl-undecaprenol N-acetylglucosamine transferase